MSRPPPKSTPTPVFVKRSPEHRRKLPPELEAFARSDEERLRIPRPRVDKGRVRDPREGYTVAGVANRDARAVYDVRASHMQALWAGGAADEAALVELGQLFHDALRLELWRARRLTDFAAFSEDVLGVPLDKAEALAEAAGVRTGEPITPLTERAIALWLRTEAGLYEGDERARARIRTGSEGPFIEIVVALSEASTALAGVGARHLPLARSPRPIEDLPRPVPRAAFDDEVADSVHDDAPTAELDEDDGVAEAAPELDDEAAATDEVEGGDEAEAGDEADEVDAVDAALDEDGLDENENAALQRVVERASDAPAGPRPKPGAGSGAQAGARLLTRKGGDRPGPRDQGDQPWGRHASREGGDRGGRADGGGGRQERSSREQPRFGDARGGGRFERGDQGPRGHRDAPQGRGPGGGGRFERRGDDAGGGGGGRFDRGGKAPGKFDRAPGKQHGGGDARGPRFGQEGGGRFGQGQGGPRFGKGAPRSGGQGDGPRFGAKAGGPRFGNREQGGGFGKREQGGGFGNRERGGGGFGNREQGGGFGKREGGFGGQGKSFGGGQGKSFGGGQGKSFGGGQGKSFGGGQGKSFGAQGGGKFGKAPADKGGKGFGARRPFGAGGGRRDDEPEE
ncbi:MAG: hypothetical protein ABW252_12105 [Polyangiales bacterium]